MTVLKRFKRSLGPLVGVTAATAIAASVALAGGGAAGDVSPTPFGTPTAAIPDPAEEHHRRAG